MVAQLAVQLDVHSMKYLPGARTVGPSLHDCDITALAVGANDVPAAP